MWRVHNILDKCGDLEVEFDTDGCFLGTKECLRSFYHADDAVSERKNTRCAIEAEMYMKYIWDAALLNTTFVSVIGIIRLWQINGYNWENMKVFSWTRSVQSHCHSLLTALHTEWNLQSRQTYSVREPQRFLAPGFSFPLLAVIGACRVLCRWHLPRCIGFSTCMLIS